MCFLPYLKCSYSQKLSLFMPSFLLLSCFKNVSKFPRISYSLLAIHSHSNFTKLDCLVETCCLRHYSWLWRFTCMCTGTRRRVKSVAKCRSSHFGGATSPFSPRNFTVCLAQGCLMGLSMASPKGCGNNTQTCYSSLFTLHYFYSWFFGGLTASASLLTIITPV